MSEVVAVTDRDEFQALLDDDRFVTVVAFTSPSWCPPCRKLEPHFEKAAESASIQSNILGRTNFVTVDPDEARWAPDEFKFMSVPTVKLFYRGEDVTDLKARTAPLLLKEIVNYFQGE